MSIWADIHKRSTGLTISKEDFAQIYTGENKETELTSGEYKGNKYAVYTNGQYPYIAIVMGLEISVFSGYPIVKLKLKDGKYYNLDRVASKNDVTYMYTFNKDTDYVEGEHDGKKYSLEIIKSFIEEFIDCILECEKDLINYAE